MKFYQLILDNNHQTIRFHFNMHTHAQRETNKIIFFFNFILLNVLSSERDLRADQSGLPPPISQMRELRHREVNDLSEVLGERGRAPHIAAGQALLEEARPKVMQRPGLQHFISQTNIQAHTLGLTPLTSIQYRIQNYILKSNQVAKDIPMCTLKRKM